MVVRRSASSSSERSASVDLSWATVATGLVSVMPQAWKMGSPTCSL